MVDSSRPSPIGTSLQTKEESESGLSPFDWSSPNAQEPNVEEAPQQVETHNNPLADEEPRYPTRVRSKPFDVYDQHLPKPQEFEFKER